jgi:hypothetical protein
MKRNSPIRSNQLKRANSDAGTSVRPKKLTDNFDCQQQPSEEISSVQESNKSSSKTTKTPNKLVKSVSSSKKPLYTRPSPYSYSTKKVYSLALSHIFHLRILTYFRYIAPTIANSC